MRNSTFAVAMTLLTAIAWFGLQGNSPRAAVAPAGVQKFEYKTTHFHGENESTLSALGDQGWEICAIVPEQPTDNTVVILKRPKQ